MERLKTYQIDLKNFFPAVKYQFDYVLGDDFFKSVDGPEVRQGNVNVSLSVVYAASAFELDFHIDGVVTVTCDRCLDDMEIPVKTEDRLIVTFGEAYAEVSDVHIVISEDEGFINVAWYMYQFIALAIPIKHVHEPGGCNEMMALKLKELCVDEIVEDEGLFQETDEQDEIGSAEPDAGGYDRPVDPRWETLRNLIRDN
ncbi:MAG: DUF177 domain-containing protein [Tannerella sp.]|nr:DUF177 domain-containing protein [Tannerella sp.]